MLKLNPNFVWRSVAGQVVAIDALDSGRVTEFDETGSMLWERIAEGAADEEALVGALLETYEIEEAEARAEVAEFLAHLRSENLLAGG